MTALFILSKLGPWLAVEIPDLISKGLVTHKEAAESKGAASAN